jgi:hypothetical protein
MALLDARNNWKVDVDLQTHATPSELLICGAACDTRREKASTYRISTHALRRSLLNKATRRVTDALLI